MNTTQPETYSLDDAGGIPNARLPVLVYHEVEGVSVASECRQLFAGNDWVGAWVNGIFSFHHFHSTAHEVLGIVAGSAAVMIGGPRGRHLEVTRGDVLVLPAGTGHCNQGSSADLVVVGAYPNGTQWDLRRGVPAERDEVLANIADVPLPDTDPVCGSAGPLMQIWRDRL